MQARALHVDKCVLCGALQYHPPCCYDCIPEEHYKGRIAALSASLRGTCTSEGSHAAFVASLEPSGHNLAYFACRMGYLMTNNRMLFSALSCTMHCLLNKGASTQVEGLRCRATSLEQDHVCGRQAGTTCPHAVHAK
jgi:hypothetical protein